MNIFQTAYNTIKNWKVPAWYKVLMQDIQEMIFSILLQIGKNYLVGLQKKILEVNGMDIEPEAKFELVFTWGKQNIPDIKDSILNMVIEILVNQLKKDRMI